MIASSLPSEWTGGPSRFPAGRSDRQQAQRRVHGRVPGGYVAAARLEERVFGFLPALVCLYVTVIFPLCLRLFPSEELESRIEHRIFWPCVAGLALLGCARRFRSLRARDVPLSLWLLGLYLALALCSLAWSAAPDIAFRRLVQQILVISAVAGPVLFSGRALRVIPSLTTAFALASAVNLVAVMVLPPTELGYAGVFTQKNTLGQFAGIGLLVAMLSIQKADRVRDRGLSLFSAGACCALLVLSQSKTSLGLALACPLLSMAVVFFGRTCRVSPVLVVLLLLAAALSLTAPVSLVVGRTFDDVSLFLFNDTTFTGRSYIWSFAMEAIERRPLIGWGYQSFWLIGQDSVSVREAPGFVASMPHAHNGYIDVLLELGVAGLTLLLAMLVAALWSAGDLSDRRPWIAAGWIAILVFVASHNLLESSWVRGADLPWVMFLIAASQPRRARDVPSRRGGGTAAPLGGLRTRLLPSDVRSISAPGAAG